MISAISNSIKAGRANSPSILYFRLSLLAIVFSTLASTVQSCSSYKTSSKIQLEKNGYKNILIAIGEDVAENYDLIDRIKSAYTEASSLLFNVTKYKFKKLYLTNHCQYVYVPKIT